MHAVHPEVVRKGSGRQYLDPVLKHRNAGCASPDRIVPVRDRVYQSFEYGPFAVLRHIDPRRFLSRRDLHAPQNEGHGFGNLCIEGAFDSLRVGPSRRAVLAPVTGGQDTGVGKKPFGGFGAEKNAGHGSARNAVLVGSQQPHSLQRQLGVRGVFGTEQRTPKFFVQRFEARPGNRAQVKRKRPRPGAAPR